MGQILFHSTLSLTLSSTFIVSCVYCSVLYPSCMYRQVTEGVWKGPEDLPSQTQKRAEDMSRTPDLDILNSPSLSLTDLSSSSGLANWMPVSASDADVSGTEQDILPSMTFRNRVLNELPSRRPADKSVSAEVRLVIRCLLCTVHCYAFWIILLCTF